MQTSDPPDTNNCEDDIYERCEAQLAAIDRLDRTYYLNKRPTTADRAAYAARQQQRRCILDRVVAELSLVRAKKPPARTDVSIRFEDKATGKPTTSAPLCRLLHDLRNDVTAILCRCETLVEDMSNGRNVAQNATSILDLVKKIAHRLYERCDDEPVQHPSKSVASS